MIEPHTFPDPKSVALAAGECLSSEISNFSGDILLLVSGGSALEVVKDIDFTQFGDRLTIGLLDERIGPPEDRNWESPVISMPIIQNVSPEVSGKDFDLKLHNWKRDHPDGKVIITQGMGEDGHTAGMMAGFDKLFDGPAWTVGYDCDGTSPFRYRVTVTNTFLKNEVDVSILYVVGEKKRDVFKNLDMTPARIIQEMKRVILFTDQRIVQ